MTTTSASFTQASITPASAIQSNSSQITGNVLIGVGVGILLVILGALIYTYRQKKGLDEDNSTLEIGDKSSPEKSNTPPIDAPAPPVGSGEPVMTSYGYGYPSTSYEGLIETYPRAAAVPASAVVPSNVIPVSEYGYVQPMVTHGMGATEIYYDKNQNYAGPFNQYFDSKGYLI